LGRIRTQIINLSLTLIFPAIVLWFTRSKLKNLVNNQFTQIVTLLSACIGLSALYIFVSVPIGCEYKFLMLFMAVVGIFISPLFAELYKEKYLLTTLSISLIFLPTILMISNMTTQPKITDSLHTNGMYIRHDDSRMDKLYNWIATKTPLNTVVVDSYLAVPALGRRSLYVATDLRRLQNPSLIFDGWYMDAKTISTQAFGENQTVVRQRLENAITLLTSTQKDKINEAADKVKSEFQNRKVVIIIRDASVQTSFENNSHFSKEFGESSVWAYSIR
jgi:AraC-like DNA-binding protein